MRKIILVMAFYFFSFLSYCQSENQQVFKADSDKEFLTNSKVSLINPTPSKIEDLTILGKVWGFLKYYHPAISKGDFNWDYELFRILPKINQCKSDIERNELLCQWIKSLGEVKKDTSINRIIERSLIKLYPDLNWITDISRLGNELSEQLILIKDAKREQEHYYFGFEHYARNPKFKNENPYNFTFPDAGFQLLCLYRYWNVIQYFFPYKNLIEESWDNVLNEFIPQFLNIQNELDYRMLVSKLIARIHDTHAIIVDIGNSDRNSAPIVAKFIENKLVVTDYTHQTLGKNSGLQIGDEILTINNKSVEEIVKNKLSMTSASNYPTQLRVIASKILRTNNSFLDITFRRGVLQLSGRVNCFSNGMLYDNHTKRDTCFKYITPEIAYLNPGSIKVSYLPEIADSLIKAKGLVIDMRCYPSEFIVFSFGKYLMPDSTAFVKFSNTSFETPGLFTITPLLKVGYKNNEYYKGKIVIIVNEETQSQAEYTTMAFRVAPQAIVIGSTTAGADGNVSYLDLPGRIKTVFSGIGVYYPNGKETQRIGIVPDIEVKPTIYGISDHRDELLDKAIDIINKSK